MQVPTNKKIYFLSDFHLGTPTHEESLCREKKIVAFLSSIEHDASEIFLLGDMFDFWYEYKTVVPKGFVRILGKLATLTDAGIQVHFFVGNHDMWMRDYLQKEMSVQVYHHPQTFTRSGKRFFIGHGDALGPGDRWYKLLRYVFFRNKMCQFIFGLIPPICGMGLANYLSRHSRAHSITGNTNFGGEQKEWLVIFCKKILQQTFYDYFVFGHRHLPIDFALPQNSRYINLGDCINYFTYAVFDGKNIALKKM